MKATRLMAVVAILALAAVPALAQKSGLSADTQHGGIAATPCEACHAPHNTVGALPLPAKINKPNMNTLLWQLSLGSASTYTVYNASTLANTATNITNPGDGALNPADLANASLLCLSCHDGSLAATNSITLVTTEYGAVNDPITGTRLDVGSTLADDHPVNITYDPLLDPGLDLVTNVTGAGVPLFGGAGLETVQCASCHDPHNNTNQDYLRIDNSSAGLCLTCHL